MGRAGKLNIGLDILDISQAEYCEKVGNMLVCLHYLSLQAGRDGLSQVSEEIDRSIAEIARKGRDIYLGHLQTVIEADAICPADFIKNFCHVIDEDVKSSLMNVVQGA